MEQFYGAIVWHHFTACVYWALGVNEGRSLHEEISTTVCSGHSNRPWRIRSVSVAFSTARQQNVLRKLLSTITTVNSYHLSSMHRSMWNIATQSNQENMCQSVYTKEWPSHIWATQYRASWRNGEL